MSLEQAIARLGDGRAQDAAPLIEEHLKQHPEDPRAWFLLGATRHALNDLARAAKAFARSSELDPSNLEAHLGCAAVLRELGSAHGTRAACERGLASLPGEPRLHCAMALALEDAGLPDEALAQYELAIAAAPDFEEAHHNRSLVLLALGRYQDALEALDRIIKRSPRDAVVLVRRGVALAALRRFPEARATFEAARALDLPAVERYLQKIAPGSDTRAMLSPENIFLWRRYAAQGVCDWSDWSGYLAEFRNAIANPETVIEPALAFVAFHLPLTAHERHAVARRIARSIEDKAPALPSPTVRDGKRIRIGILSPDFREHLNAYLFLPLFELLDRHRFELYAYSLARDDGSAIRRRVEKAADRFSEVAALSDMRAAQRIRDDEVDILLDACGHTKGGRFGITALRPAPIQAVYLGFSGSLGSSRVDYAIVDRIVAPAGISDAWSEALVYLPSTYYLYDFREDVPASPISRRDYGLPEDAFVYCAFHKAEKITPDTFDLWMRILIGVPRSVMWFLALPNAAAANLRAAAKLRGIDPSRLHFAPFEPRGERYLPRQRLGDLMVDALHHNAMTTACDALGAGLPVLSVRGSSMASRAAESLLRAAGLQEELVAADPRAFVEYAVRLGRDPELLSGLRQRLIANRCSAPLFDTAARVRELEAAFQRMHERTLRGEPPLSFALDA